MSLTSGEFGGGFGTKEQEESSRRGLQAEVERDQICFLFFLVDQEATRGDLGKSETLKLQDGGSYFWKF